jgi:hypothetical protein
MLGSILMFIGTLFSYEHDTLNMSGSSTSSMRRGWKSALLGMGAVASVPTAILIADDYIDVTNGSKLRRHQRAKIELWKEDAEGFITTAVDRILNNVGRGRPSRKEAPPSECNSIQFNPYMILLKQYKC